MAIVNGRFLYFISQEKDVVKVVYIYDTLKIVGFVKEIQFLLTSGEPLKLAPKAHLHIEQLEMGGPITIWAQTPYEVTKHEAEIPSSFS